MHTILVVDDGAVDREDVARSLRDMPDIRIIEAHNGAEALEMLAKELPDMVLTDLRMPGMSGLDLLSRIKEQSPDLPVIMITAFASPDDAVSAMNSGAFDYISKPFNVDEIKSVIESATSQKSATKIREKMTDSFPDIIGKSKEMLKIFDIILRIAPTPASVLIYGESGTGKELVAKAIHAHSSVDQDLFIPITCSAIPEELMESELFGHVKGSFTGAIGDKSGLFMQANNGTAFLDEIGELSSIIQTKLLRVLQEREIKPVGSTTITPLNVRIVAATNRILEEEILAGRFREDLFYRLAVVPIRVPPLRERKGDVPLLVDHFLKKYSKLLGKEIQKISSYALQVLMDYNFPGNVRELENIIERGVALESSNIILPESLTLTGSLHPETAESEGNTSMFMAVENDQELFDTGLEKVITRLEKRFIEYALEKTGNSKMKAADLLQVSFRSLRYKTKKYGID